MPVEFGRPKPPLSYRLDSRRGETEGKIPKDLNIDDVAPVVNGEFEDHCTGEACFLCLLRVLRIRTVDPDRLGDVTVEPR